MSLPVTIVIPVRNDAENLDRCLRNATGFDSILVVDSNSTDATRQVAESFGARVVPFQWDGRFPKKRNWVLRERLVTTPWVLFLDADEVVTDDFRAELDSVLSETPHAGFWVDFDDFFLGHPLRHGLRMRKLCLFRPGKGEYERVDETHSSDPDMEIHEHPIVTGSVGTIRARLIHHDRRTVHAYLARHNAYSTWEARRYLALQTSPGAQQAHLTPRQQRKYRFLAKWWLSPAYFLGTYLGKLGFLDGRAGFHFALLKAFYFYQIRLKIREQLAERPVEKQQQATQDVTDIHNPD